MLCDCHSIRSRIPRLFAGELPNFNIGTNSGASCAPELTARIAALCAATDFSHVVNGRFKGGYTTATTDNLPAACMPCKWSWHAGVICASPRKWTRVVGLRLTKKNTPRPCERCSSASLARASDSPKPPAETGGLAGALTSEPEPHTDRDERRRNRRQHLRVLGLDKPRGHHRAGS